MSNDDAIHIEWGAPWGTYNQWFCPCRKCREVCAMIMEAQRRPPQPYGGNLGKLAEARRLHWLVELDEFCKRYGMTRANGCRLLQDWGTGFRELLEWAESDDFIAQTLYEEQREEW